MAVHTKVGAMGDDEYSLEEFRELLASGRVVEVMSYGEAARLMAHFSDVVEDELDTSDLGALMMPDYGVAAKTGRGSYRTAAVPDGRFLTDRPSGDLHVVSSDTDDVRGLLA